MKKVKSFFYLAAGGMGRQGCFFIAFSIIASRIQADEFGMLSYWYAIVLVLAGCSDWGMRFWGWRQVAQEPENWRVINGIAIIKIVVGSGILIAYILTIEFIINSQKEMLLALALAGCIVINQLTVDWVYRGFNKYGTVGFIGLVSGVAFLVGVQFNPWPTELMMYGIILVVSNAIGNLYPLLAIRKVGWRWESIGKREVMLPLLEGSKYVGLSVLSRFYLNYPLILLGLIGSLNEVGIFRIGQMIYAFMVSISYYVVGAIYIKLAQGVFIKENTLSMLRKVSIGCLLIIVPVTMIITPFIEDITTKLFGMEYMESVDLIYWLLWLVPLGFLHMLWRESIPAFSNKALGARSIILATVIGSATCVGGYSLAGLHGIIVGIAAGELVGMSYCALFAVQDKRLARDQQKV